MIFEDNAIEELKQRETDQQQAIDSYNNYDLKTTSPYSAAAPKKESNGKEAPVEQPTSKQLRQNEEDDLKTGDVTEDNHGKKFISDDDEFFEPPPAKKQKVASMMDHQHEVHAEDTFGVNWDEIYTATEETTYDEEYKASSFEADEGSYEQEFDDYTYDVSSDF